MATEKKIVANRKNGLKGGVKTAEGKAISSKNSYKHGLTTKQLTSFEEKELYKKVLNAYLTQYTPDDLIGYMLCERVALYYTKILRVANLESAYINRTDLVQKINYLESIQPSCGIRLQSDFGSLFDTAEDEKRYYEISKLISPLRKELIIIDRDHLSVSSLNELQKIQSYQTTLENAFYKAIEKLERYIASRRKMFSIIEQ